MGYLLRAVCQCGYQSNELAEGAGFASMRTGLVFTMAYCDDCESVQSAAVADEPPACETCHKQLAYYEDGLNKLSPPHKSGKTVEAQSWHCPVCKSNSLHFEWIGLWD